MSQLSAVVLTKNNQASIQRTLQSLTWCQEILVIDDQSTDTTVSIAKKYTEQIFIHRLINFSEQRNYALQQAKHQWILFVDSDEVVSEELAQEIQQAINNESFNGYYLKREDVFFGKRLQFGETAHVRLLRLAKKTAGEWKGTVHETWEIAGATTNLVYPLLHYPHPTIGEFLADINNYSSLVAQERIKKGETVAWWQIIMYPLGKFIQNYIIRQGFRDGTHGAVMALMMSFHSFLVKGKMYGFQKK
jgi:glycosyltransferase involved in cell wall biosynthesis